jgi:hypothetical protein
MGAKAWMLQRTRDNLLMLRKAFAKAGSSIAELDDIIGRIEGRLLELNTSKEVMANKEAG